MHALLALIMTLAEVDRLELAWDAPPECGTQDEVLLAIDSLLEGATSRPEPVSAAGSVLRQHDAYVLTLEIHEGRRSQRRELSAATCGELLDAGALILAMTLDPRLSAQPHADRPSAIPEPSAAGTAYPSTTPASETPPPVDAEPAPPPRPRARLRPPSTWLGATAGIGVGPLPALAPVVTLVFAIGGPLWRVELETGAWLPRLATSTSNADHQAEIWMWTFGARACAEPAWRRVSFPLCAGVETGPMIGSGRGNLRSETGVSAWVAATAVAGAILWPTPRWGFALRVLGHVALRRPQFDTDPSGEILHTAGPAGAQVLAGVNIRLR